MAKHCKGSYFFLILFTFYCLVAIFLYICSQNKPKMIYPRLLRCLKHPSLVRTCRQAISVSVTQAIIRPSLVVVTVRVISWKCSLMHLLDYFLA